MSFVTKAMRGLSRALDLDAFTWTTKSEMYAWFNVLDGIDSGAVLSSLRAFSNNTWVHKCVNVIASSGAMLPLEVWNDTKKLDNHRFVQFMRNPNPYLTQEQLLYRTLAIMMIHGECFWWIIRSGSRVTNNMPESVWIIDPRMVVEELSQTYPQTLLAWKVRTPFGDLRLDPLDVAQFKIPHPDKPWRGCSPMEAAGLAISADVAMAKWNARFFRNSALPAGILTTEQPLTETQARQIRKRWEETSRGEENAHRIQVTYRGLKWMPLTGTNRDMEFKEGRNQNREEICAAFGVPGVKLGLLDGATYANSEQQKEIFWTQTMMPLLRLIEATLERAILREDPFETYFNTDNVEDMRSIIARKVETAVKMFSIGWPLNKIDKRLDIGMGDVEWGDDGYLPYTLQSARLLLEGPDLESDPSDPHKKPTDPNADPADPNAPPPANLPPAKAFEYVRKHVGAWTLKGEFRAKVLGALEDVTKLAETELLPNEAPALDVADETRQALIDVLRNDATNEPDGERVLHALKQVVGVPLVPAAHRATTVFDRILDWQPTLYVSDRGIGVDDITSVLDAVYAKNGLLQKLGAKYIKQGFSLGVNQANELLAVDFKLDNPAAKTFLEAKELKFVDVQNTTAEQIRAALLSGLDKGLGSDELADAVVDVFDVAYARARTIARTEVATSANGGRYLAFKDSGAEKQAWLTSEDDRVRDTHVQVNGEEVELGELFPFVNLLYPGDPDGEADQVINCRCVAVPVFSNIEQNALFGSGYIKALSDAKREVLWRKQTVGLTLPERQFTKALKKFFKQQKADVLAKIAELNITT